MEPEALRALLPPDMGLLSNGEIDSVEFWRRFEARTGIRPEWNWWAECFKPTRDEATFAIVRELAGVARTVCGTNTIDCHHLINQNLGMYEPFHAVYASHLIHRSKPDPRFWLEIKAFVYADAASHRWDLISVGAAIAP